MKKIQLIVSVFVLVFNSSVVGAISNEDRLRLFTPFYDPDAEVIECTSLATGGASSGRVPDNYNLGADKEERRTNLVKALVSDYGLTTAQASGVVGNFMIESAGTQTVAEGVPPNVNQGDTTGAPPKFDGGYGWAQWTGPRQVQFVDYAIENGYMSSENDEATDAANYAFLKFELQNGYQSTITELKNTTSPEDAAISFESTYERAGVPAISRRTAAARQVYGEVLNQGGGIDLNSGCGGFAVVIDGAAFPLIGPKSVVKNPEIFSGGDTDIYGHPYTAYDIIADEGVQVAAFTSGTVVRAGTDKCGGGTVQIYNAELDIVASSLHLNTTGRPQIGSEVNAGQLIGFVGGDAAGCGVPHLHLDVANGNSRPGCQRESCPDSSRERFIDIGEQLNILYQGLADG